jgi:CubicO group peptidase (beta-lactamase class C family)
MYFPPLTGSTWDTISVSSLGWCQDKMDSLLAFMGRENTKAFILLKNGKIVTEKYYGTFTKDSLWYWASAGKTLTAFTTGIAQHEGYLSINDSTSKYLGTGWTSCPSNKEKLITVKHQLSMNTGLDDGVPDPDCTLSSCLQYLSDAGTRWAYHNAPYTRLDGVIQNAVGTTLNSYVTTRIKNKTGMDGFFFNIGYNNVYFSKARSMARFGLLLLNKGYWNTTPVLSDTVYFNQMINTSQPLNLSYGYLTWLNGKSSFMVPSLQFVFPGKLMPNAPDDAYFALGKNGQFIDVYPSQKIVFIRMGNSPASTTVDFALNDSICRRLNEVMCVSTNQNTALNMQNDNIKVYPNPASEKIYLNLPTYEMQKAEITDMSGKSLATYYNTNEIPLQYLPQGLYFIRCTTRNGVYIHKFVKN